MKRYETMAGRPLDEDIAVAVVIESCVKELRDRLETVPDMVYKEVLDDIVAFIERRRVSSTNGPTQWRLGTGRKRSSRCATHQNSSLGKELHSPWVWTWRHGDTRRVCIGRKQDPQKLPMHMHHGEMVWTLEARAKDPSMDRKAQLAKERGQEWFREGNGQRKSKRRGKTQFHGQCNH